MDQDNVRPYYYCLVPQCKSTTKVTPCKLFFNIPADPTRRRLWLNSMRRTESELSIKTRGNVCEDHFNLEKDMENWIMFKTMGGQKKLKKDVVPHIFDCWAGRTCTAEMYGTRQLSGETTGITPEYSEQSSSTPTPISITEMDCRPVCVKAVQVNIKPHVRSKYAACVPSQLDKSVLTSPIKMLTKNVMTSPIKDGKKQSFATTSSGTYISTESEISSASLADTSGELHVSEEYSSSEKSVVLEDAKKMSLRTTLFYMEHEPRLYMGIPIESFFVINLLHEKTSLKAEDIMLTLKKIRTNHPFSMLGHDFGISESYASKIFSKIVPLIAHYFRQLIIWNPKSHIRKELPTTFIARYSDVESIIDCLEIEIQKPSDPIKQSLTWSSYKSTNTIKYFISCTPDGIVNYVSAGVSGRITDTEIVEICGYLDILEAHRPCAVLADRGFKHIDKHINSKGCKLVRPPSVSSGVKLSREQVLQGKKIASLRIHIERLIRRVREFSFLAPHACIPNSLMSSIDDVVNIACGIINLQPKLIKK